MFFQQLALNARAVSNKWSASGYWLLPIGPYGWGQNESARLNSFYVGDSLNTIGGDFAYNITPDVKLSLGYYYQDGDLNTADSSGVKTRLGYIIANGVTVGFTYSYDSAFKSVATGDIKWRYGSNSNGVRKKKKAWETPVIQALSATPANRDVRVHDGCYSRVLSTPYHNRSALFEPPIAPFFPGQVMPLWQWPPFPLHSVLRWV